MAEDMTDLRPGYWDGGELPPNVRLGPGTVISGEHAFRRLRTERDPGLVVGRGCHLEQAQFSYGPAGYIEIGDHCVFTNAILMCEQEIRIGHRVVIGWNSYVADSNFHPLEPLARVEDAIACSPMGAARGVARPAMRHASVVINDDVWIGPACTILKGVRIGAGAFIEAGTVVTADVAPRSRVMGNPARVIDEV